MRKFTLTTLTVIGVVLGTTAFANTTGDKDVKVKPVNDEKVELTYLTDSRCKVKVNIYDQEGKKVFGEYISNSKSFSKAYDLSSLPAGEYAFEVIDNDKVVVEKVKTFEMPSAKAEIIQESDEKYKVTVKGTMVNPVAINIYDKFGKLIYGDFVDLGTGFTRTYDMSKSIKSDVLFEVVQDGKVIAETKF